MPPPSPTLLKVRGATVELDRAQDNVQRALTELNSTLVQYVDEEIAAIPAPVAVSSITPFGVAPNAAGGTIVGTALTLQPADATNPGGVSTGNQSFAGQKTFLADLFAAQHANIAATFELRFNNSTTQHLKYESSPSARLEYSAPLHHFVGGNMQFDALIASDRYGIITKDDQSGTPGNFTTTRSAGRAAFAAGATAVVITNNTAGKAFAATDDVYWSWLDDDATAVNMRAVAAANTITFTIAGGLTATAITRFSWWVLK